jgi:outer membrane receptor protein involved in Fe transport
MKKLLGLAAVSFGMVMICFAFVVGSTALAQATNGTIAGTVVDPAGAGVSGATVKATSLETNDTRSAVTSKVGSYRIESVPPGNYKIDVSATSFATETVSSVNVPSSVITSVDVKLTIGAASTDIEVSSDVVAALKTDSGELSDTLTAVEINDLPISTLNPYQLGTTLPGVTVVTGDNFTNGYGFSVNGNRPRDNNFLVESVDNDDQGLHGQAFQPENIEAVQEITFLLDSFSAEYGRGGAVSNLVMKSGSNTFHGAVYERLANTSLNGEDKGEILNKVTPTKSRENWYGFRFSGAAVHNRLFFFVSNQWDHYRSSTVGGILTLPTAAGYTLLQQYSSNPQVANLLKAYSGLVGTNPNYATSLSLGNDASGNSRGTVNFAGEQQTVGDDQNSRELEATSDYIASDKDKLRFRFIQSPNSVPLDLGNFPNQLPGFYTDQHGVTYNAGIVETHIFSPTMLNELRPAWTRIGFSFDLQPATYANPLAIGPAIGITGITGYGIPGNVPQGRFQNTYQLEDAFSWTKGTHSIKIGFDIEDQRIKDGIPFVFYGSIGYARSAAFCTGGTTPCTPTTPGYVPSYTSLGNFIDNLGGTSSSASIQFGSPTARPMIWVQSYFAEDSWKIAHNFTLDFGLRYEYDGAPLNYLPYPTVDSSNPTVFNSTTGYLTRTPELPNHREFAPRAGFNYAFDEKTVISGGAGLFYNHVFTNIIDNIQGSSPNAASKLTTSSATGRGTPNWSNAIATIQAGSHVALAGDTSNFAVNNLKEPLTFEYNLRLQRVLPAEFVLAAEYVGNRSEHLYATTEFNPYVDDLLSANRIFNNRGRMIREDNTADSNYNSLQLEAQHKSKGGLTLRADYTYSKLLDDGSEIFTDASANLSTYEEIQYPSPRNREWAASAFDHRNRIVVSAVYVPPTWHTGEGYHWAGAIVNGWAFSGISTFQSGQPVNVEIGYDWNGDGISNDRPILLNKSAPITHWAIKGDDPLFGFGLPAGTLCDGPAWWATNDNCHPVTTANTHWVASYAGSTQNTVSRNYLFADHQSNTDFTLQRSFKTFERQDFMIRMEALNVFNHGPTGSFNADLITGVPYNGTDTLGNVYSGNVTFDNKPLTVSGSRNIRFFARYEF